MIAISEIRLYDILKSKFKLSEADAKEIIAEVAIANEKTDRVIDAKVDTRFISLRETFATKDDIHKLEVRLEQTKVDNIKWMFGFWVTLVLLILANWFLKK